MMKTVLVNTALDLGTPGGHYSHAACVGNLVFLSGQLPVNAQGEKLSKQTFADALPRQRPVPVLWRVLDFLGQNPAPTWQEARLDEFWQLAREHWRPDAIPCQTVIRI